MPRASLEPGCLLWGSRRSCYEGWSRACCRRTWRELVAGHGVGLGLGDDDEGVDRRPAVGLGRRADVGVAVFGAVAGAGNDTAAAEEVAELESARAGERIALEGALGLEEPTDGRDDWSARDRRSKTERSIARVIEEEEGADHEGLGVDAEVDGEVDFVVVGVGPDLLGEARRVLDAQLLHAPDVPAVGGLDAEGRPAEVADAAARPLDDLGSKFPTLEAPLSAISHSFRLIFGHSAIISRSVLEAWTGALERARAEHSR